MKEELAERGYVRVPGVLDAAAQAALREALGSVAGAGRRGLLAIPAVRALARSAPLRALAGLGLEGEPFPVRAIFFDKTPAANWAVAWHQDLTLAVAERVELPGFGPWSTKDGMVHVQPPAAVLERMLTVRLHLDDADEANGALRVIPGSHREGRLSAEAIQAWRGREAEVLCAAAAGDALVMRPLLLHASSRAAGARHRRVLHLEYAATPLPGGLRWHETA
ncbi:MAG: hypothetical protein RJA22_516 [Verrucomicrobiota bacterium]|jgi:hypothetical protein